MNLDHATTKGLRECREARRELQQLCPAGDHVTKPKRKPSWFARLLHSR